MRAYRQPKSLGAAHRVRTSTVQQGFTWSATESPGATVLGVGQLVVGHNSVSDPLPTELTNLIQDCRLDQLVRHLVEPGEGERDSYAQRLQLGLQPLSVGLWILVPELHAFEGLGRAKELRALSTESHNRSFLAGSSAGPVVSGIGAFL